jgi:hypothetical protein
MALSPARLGTKSDCAGEGKQQFGSNSVYVCMRLALVPELLNGWYAYSVSTSLTVTYRCPVNVDIPPPKLGVFDVGPKTRKAIKKTAITISIKFQWLYRDHLPK